MTGVERTGRPPARASLAVLLCSPVLLATVVVVVVSLMALAKLGAGAEATADAGLARIGEDLALVIVTENGIDIAATRSIILHWGIVAPVAVAAAAALVAWWVSGRVRRKVLDARNSVEIAEQQRQGRLAELAHELRTPLAVMGTNLELAGFESDPGGESIRYIEAARRAVGRMSRTVDDLAGHGELTVETGDDPVDLAQIAEALAAESSGPAHARAVRIRLAGRAPVVIGQIDAAAVRGAAANFMSNAMRMAPAASEIVVDWGTFEEWAWLTVSDQGPGLGPQHHARAFERGWQGAHDRDRHEGSGLGLTIARHLTEAQGGLVTIESEEGGGAILALWLPTGPDADRDTVVTPDRIHPAVRPWVRSAAGV